MIGDLFESVQVQETLSVLRVIFFDDEENIDMLMSHKETFATTKHVPVLSNRSELKALHELIKLCYRKIS